ncbi:DUF1281 domain-containing protein, partial [Escherichia coli]
MSTVYHRPADPSGDDSYVRPLFADRCQAGFPSPATDYAEQELDLNSYCISRPAATFFLRASGESMNQAGVQNGDLLVVDRAEKPQHGDIVIAEIKRLASGAVTPLYRRATNEGIQLFLAGSAGLLQITENIRSEQCPGVTAAGRGAVSPENIAFTRWLTHLQNGVLLDEQNCLMLHELWLQSGTGQRRWEELPDDVRETITVHFTAKRGDWCDIWGNEDVSVWWNRLCD